jgi:uncharacterized membrane protein
MESYLLDWANLLLRWAHVITAIAWIGASFYFVFLDSSLSPPVDEELKRQGATGELWAVHGGGFYHPVKYAVPPQLPANLHWFYWEAYSTWLTGFALFTVSYLWNPSTYLIDKSRMDWSPGMAIAVALSFLLVFGCMTQSAKSSAGANTVTASSACAWPCWCVWRLTWRAAGLRGAQRFC